MRRAILFFIFLVAFGLAAMAQQGYDWWDATEESYWYALSSASALIQSGFGIPLEGRSELLSRVIAEAGLARGDGRVLSDLPIALPYASGQPLYVQSGSQKWVDRNRDTAIRTEAVAWTMIAFASQAKQMERLYQIGIGQSNETRFEAMIRGILASEAASITHMQMRDGVSGLYWDERGVGSSQSPSLKPTDQFLMLWALSELNTLSDGYGFYRGTVSWLESGQWAESLFQAIVNYSQENPNWLTLTPGERALFIEALSAFGATSGNLSLLEDLVNMLREQTELLGTEVSAGSPTLLKAKAVRALIAAQRMTGNETLRATALQLWNSIKASWDAAAGVFYLQPGSQEIVEYSAADVADLVGALGAVIYGAGLEGEMTTYAQFFRQTLKASRLVVSERDEAGGDFDGDEVTGSESAGGPFGAAPVFVSRVEFRPDSGEWHVTNSNFDTTAAMALSTQLVWIGQRDHQSYMGPPRYGLPLSREAQFIGIQQQLSQIKASQVQVALVESLRVLLENAESEIANLKKRLIGPADLTTSVRNLQQQMDAIRAQLAALENAQANSNTESHLASIDARLKALEERAPSTAQGGQATGGAITNDLTITVILIVLLLLVGFVAYQRVIQRAIREEA